MRVCTPILAFFLATTALAAGDEVLAIFERFKKVSEGVARIE